MNYMKKYRELQQFTNLKEFDSYRKYLFYKIKDKLSKGALAVWNQLSQRSIEVPGVCWVQIDTIAEGAGVSRSTVERAIRLFKKLGVIEVKETTRPKTGGDGANVYVFQKLGEGAEMKGRQKSENACPEKVESQNSENDTKIPLYSFHNIHLHNKNWAYIKYVPKKLQHFQSIFGRRVKDLYGRVWLAAKNLGLTVEQEVMQEIGHIAMSQLHRYGDALQPEEQNKCAYKIAIYQLQQRVERGEIFDFSGLFAIAEKIAEQKPKKITAPISHEELDQLGIY